MADLLHDPDSTRTKILIVNDDGQSKGVETLARTLAAAGADVLVVIPFSQKIHPSFSITTNDTCTAVFREKFSTDNIKMWAILQTPIDCIKFGLNYLVKEKMKWDTPDIVVSGINHGVNVGTELLYSGTIAAAFGARFESSVPALAISQAIPSDKKGSDIDFTVAAKVAQSLVKIVIEHGLPPNTIWNVNIPEKPIPDKNGLYKCAVTRPGTSIPKGNPLSGVEITGKGGDEKIKFSLPLRQFRPINQPFGTDCAALQNNVVSITPLHLRPDLHCPAKASITLKNHIKYCTDLKLDNSHSWDTEHPKGRKSVVDIIDTITDFSEKDTIPMHTIIYAINNVVYGGEHYMGPDL
eukprot:UN34877